MFLKIFKIPFLVLRDIGKLFVIYMPGGFGTKLRYLYYKNKLKSCGKNVIIDTGVHIDGTELISIGDNVYIDKYCIISTGKKLIGDIKRKQNHDFSGEEGEIIIGNNIHIAQFCIIMGYGGVEIGDNVGLSTGTKIYSLTNIPNAHGDNSKIISIMPLGSYEAPYICSPVVLKHNSWMGIGTVILPNVTIGEHSFCANYSVVITKIKNNSYISGQPAKKIKERFQRKETV